MSLTLNVRCVFGARLTDDCLRVIEIDESDSLFDLGDQWTFEVRPERKRKEPEPGATYPRVVHAGGPNPEQYPFDNE